MSYSKSRQLAVYEARVRNAGAKANEKAIKRDQGPRAVENNDIEANTAVEAHSSIAGLQKLYKERGIATEVSGDALARRKSGQDPKFDEGK